MPINIFNTFDDPLGTGTTEAWGVNDTGQIVGDYDNGTGFHGFLESGGTYTTLDDPLATGGTFANGINDAGQIVGTYVIGNTAHGFLYSGGQYTTVDDPLATFGNTALGINNNGQIVGTLSDSTGNHGYLETTLPNPPPPAGTTADMILRRADGTYEIYDIGNNAILAGYELGHVGTGLAFVTLDGFKGSDTTDMLLRNVNTGGFEVYHISNNNSTGAVLLGTVGMD